MLLSSRNELFLVQTWTPGWAPGPAWTTKKLFSRAGSLVVVLVWSFAKTIAQDPLFRPVLCLGHR